MLLAAAASFRKPDFRLGVGHTRPGPRPRVNYLSPAPQDKEQELLGEEMRREQGEVEPGEGTPSFKTPREGQCFLRQGPHTKPQLVSLGPRWGSVGIISHLFPLVAAALTCSTRAGKLMKKCPEDRRWRKCPVISHLAPEMSRMNEAQTGSCPRLSSYG